MNLSGKTEIAGERRSSPAHSPDVVQEAVVLAMSLGEGVLLGINIGACPGFRLTFNNLKVGESSRMETHVHLSNVRSALFTTDKSET
jgi:hypothetical protein